MFNSGTYDGPPVPWDPKEHPEWAAASDAARKPLRRFEEAAKRRGYSTPVETGDHSDDLPEGSQLLMGMVLPHLAGHRQMLKSLLADSWRTGDDGKVSPERLLNAWKTGFRAAGHLTDGSTLIENLVGLAEGNLIEENARWALKHGIFDQARLEEALGTLRDYATYETDLARSLRAEHGAAMDLIQYLFSPPNAQGQPQINTERLDAMARKDFLEPELVGPISRMNGRDANATLEVFDRHYRNLTEQMQIGYPDVRAADIQAMEQQAIHTTPLASALMPAMSRYHKLRTRYEASRRATQLA
jgi:hypothetical protein